MSLSQGHIVDQVRRSWIRGPVERRKLLRGPSAGWAQQQALSLVPARGHRWTAWLGWHGVGLSLPW